jgi:hypothetical protein
LEEAEVQQAIVALRKEGGAIAKLRDELKNGAAKLAEEDWATLKTSCAVGTRPCNTHARVP